MPSQIPNLAALVKVAGAAHDLVRLAEMQPLRVLIPQHNALMQAVKALATAPGATVPKGEDARRAFEAIIGNTVVGWTHDLQWAFEMGMMYALRALGWEADA